ncbi:MAG: hypothetical protein AAF693_00900 [Bacteroidota bacterium]
MKKLILKLIASSVISWVFLNSLVDKLVLVRNYVRSQKNRDIYREKELFEAESSIISKSQVLNGLFKQMKYPKLKESDGRFIHGNVVPKLLGSYENELHEVITNLLENSYSDLLVIGCAEGYYSIGLQLIKGFKRNISFDIDPRAKKRFWDLANANGLTRDQLTFKEFCSPEFLANYSFSGKGLVICDCEGYEVEVFNEYNISNLANCDLIIELHDFVKSVSGKLINLFSHTHQIEFVNSLAPAHKLRILDENSIKHLQLENQFDLISEDRPHQEWMILTSL